MKNCLRLCIFILMTNCLQGANKENGYSNEDRETAQLLLALSGQEFFDPQRSQKPLTPQNSPQKTGLLLTPRNIAADCIKLNKGSDNPTVKRRIDEEDDEEGEVGNVASKRSKKEKQDALMKLAFAGPKRKVSFVDCLYQAIEDVYLCDVTTCFKLGSDRIQWIFNGDIVRDGKPCKGREKGDYDLSFTPQQLRKIKDCYIEGQNLIERNTLGKFLNRSKGVDGYIFTQPLSNHIKKNTKYISLLEQQYGIDEAKKILKRDDIFSTKDWHSRSGKDYLKEDCITAFGKFLLTKAEEAKSSGIINF